MMTIRCLDNGCKPARDNDPAYAAMFTLPLGGPFTGHARVDFSATPLSVSPTSRLLALFKAIVMFNCYSSIDPMEGRVNPSWRLFDMGPKCFLDLLFGHKAS